MAGQLTSKTLAISPAGSPYDQMRRRNSRHRVLDRADSGSRSASIATSHSLRYCLIKSRLQEDSNRAGPLMHTVTIKGEPDEIYKAISTGKGLGSFWTRDSQAEPKVGSIAKFGFGGPKLELKVAELKPGKLVRWSDAGGFPGWEGTTITCEIAPAKDGRPEARFRPPASPHPVPPSALL